MRTVGELQGTLRGRDAQIAEYAQKERTRSEVVEAGQERKLREADDQAASLEAALAGREQRHKIVLETLGSLRKTLSGREVRVAELEARVKCLEQTDLPAAHAARASADEAAVDARVRAEGAEARVAELRSQFDAATAQAGALTIELASMSEQLETAHARCVTPARRRADGRTH